LRTKEYKSSIRRGEGKRRRVLTFRGVLRTPMIKKTEERDLSGTKYAHKNKRVEETRSNGWVYP